LGKKFLLSIFLSQSFLSTAFIFNYTSSLSLSLTLVKKEMNVTRMKNSQTRRIFVYFYFLAMRDSLAIIQGRWKLFRICTKIFHRRRGRAQSRPMIAKCECLDAAQKAPSPNSLPSFVPSSLIYLQYGDGERH
jgi:hypothetical protein